MDTVKRSLMNLGFSDKEIQIYFFLLENGASAVLEIAKVTNIPRATVYLIIDRLVGQGLVSRSAAGKKKRWLASPPEKLLQTIELKKSAINQAVAAINQSRMQLQALSSAKTQKPKIRYYEGVEGIKSIYEDSLSAEEIDVFCLTQNGPRVMGDYLKKYFVRVIRKMIITKDIVSDSKDDKEYQREYSTSRNKIVCIPSRFITNTDYMIYKNCVAFITYRDRVPVGIVIEDNELARFERMRFKILWKVASRGRLNSL
ncbi:hypothetical protein M1523_03595 [Patescibacteria group bacterium]|nr:hypothetical protein [Patescibacteria group bacterium]MCL5091610.1 hypothetical protein [Patescibacteria group bacterium]